MPCSNQQTELDWCGREMKSLAECDWCRSGGIGLMWSAMESVRRSALVGAKEPGSRFVLVRILRGRVAKQGRA